jgi:hypothetical protein
MQSVPNPIQAKTLVKLANNSRGTAARGTRSVSPARHASPARISPATTPATPREASGGHSRSRIFMAGQFSAQPVVVTTRSRRPSLRSRGEASDMSAPG